MAAWSVIRLSPGLYPVQLRISPTSTCPGPDLELSKEVFSIIVESRRHEHTRFNTKEQISRRFIRVVAALSLVLSHFPFRQASEEFRQIWVKLSFRVFLECASKVDRNHRNTISRHVQGNLVSARTMLTSGYFRNHESTIEQFLEANRMVELQNDASTSIDPFIEVQNDLIPQLIKITSTHIQLLELKRSILKPE